MSLIELVGLSQKYGDRTVLNNINVNIEKGEVFALIGPTGAGKTTLLRLIDLLEVPTSGKIYFDGIDTTALGRMKLRIRRRMAFVLQKPRVAIARALAVEPEVLLLDEPTANLDPISTLKIEELIQNIFRQYRTTIVMATHDLSQGRRLAHRIGVMVDGEIIQVGKADEVFNSPTNREVAEFVGVENIISGVIVSRDGDIVTIDLNGKLIEAISDGAVGDEVYACIRPEDVTLAPSKAISSARNALAGEITRVVLTGSLVHVEVDCGFSLIALVTKKSTEELKLRSGDQIYAGFKASAVHVIKKQ